MLLLLLSLLGPAAQGRQVSEFPVETREAGLLICEDPSECAADAAWVEDVHGDAGLPFVALNLVLELDAGGWADGEDQQARFDAALVAGREALEKKRWGALRGHAADALDALEKTDLTFGPTELFLAWYLDGAAQLHTAKKGTAPWEHSFRQAAVLAGEHAAFPDADDSPTRRAFTDALRQLKVGGSGTIELTQLEPDVEVWVNGTPVPVSADDLALGRRNLPVFAGTHRITALKRGAVRTWRADVPVLGGRTSTVALSFSPADDASWMRAQLFDAFQTMEAPTEVTALLAAWCTRHGLDSVRVMTVEEARTIKRVPPVALGKADPLRPEAAGGERVDMGDGVASTFEEHVTALAEERVEAPNTVRRLRVVYFDPTSARFHPDAGTHALLATPQRERFRIGARLGYTQLLDHHHVAADIVLHARTGPIDTEGRIGLVRSDTAHNLYVDWTDRQLMHAALGARWSPRGTWAPFIGAGAEVYIPVGFGIVGTAGLQWRFSPSWVATAEADLGLLFNAGPAWGAGLFLGRTY